MVAKRKAVEDLSDNPNTIRVRKRLAAMDDTKLSLEKAKRADSAAVTYAIKKLRQTTEYKVSNEETKKSMEKEKKEEVMHKRKADGTHAEILAKKLGLGAIGGLYATNVDENPAWVDTDDEDDLEAEARWRWEDQINSHVIVEIDKDEYEEKLRLKAERRRIDPANSFQVWQGVWLSHINSLRSKIRVLNEGMPFLRKYTKVRAALAHYRGSISDIQMAKARVLVGGSEDKAENIDLVTPSEFFTEEEKAAWRNLAACGVWDVDDEGWAELPGPAEWWTNNYDYESNGFEVPLSHEGYVKAFNMLFSATIPKEFAFVDPSNKELKVLTNTRKTIQLLDSYNAMH